MAEAILNNFLNRIHQIFTENYNKKGGMSMWWLSLNVAVFVFIYTFSFYFKAVLSIIY